jgi:hypothetical protein
MQEESCCNSFLIEKLSHGPAGLNRQVTAKEHAIETSQRGLDLFLMFAYKLFHGTPSVE